MQNGLLFSNLNRDRIGCIFTVVFDFVTPTINAHHRYLEGMIESLLL